MEFKSKIISFQKHAASLDREVKKKKPTEVVCNCPTMAWERMQADKESQGPLLGGNQVFEDTAQSWTNLETKLPTSPEFNIKENPFLQNFSPSETIICKGILIYTQISDTKLSVILQTKREMNVF